MSTRPLPHFSDELPWVNAWHSRKLCEAYTNDLKACRNRAAWTFTALPESNAKDGVFCRLHLLRIFDYSPMELIRAQRHITAQRKERNA